MGTGNGVGRRKKKCDEKEKKQKGWDGGAGLRLR